MAESSNKIQMKLNADEVWFVNTLREAGLFSIAEIHRVNGEIERIVINNSYKRPKAVADHLSTAGSS